MYVYINFNYAIALTRCRLCAHKQLRHIKFPQLNVKWASKLNLHLICSRNRITFKNSLNFDPFCCLSIQMQFERPNTNQLFITRTLFHHFKNVKDRGFLFSELLVTCHSKQFVNFCTRERIDCGILWLKLQLFFIPCSSIRK